MSAFVNKLWILPVIAATALHFCGSAAADDVKLDVSVNRTQVYVGESLVLTAKVAGMDRPPEPDLSGIEGFDARFLGSHSDSRQSISIVNGKVRRESYTGRTFSYELTPREAGRFVAGPVVLNVGGKALRASGPAVTVSGIEEQDWVKLRIEASRETVLVDEPFEITLMVDLLSLEGRYAAVDPIDPTAPPRLEVGFLDNAPIEGLEAPKISEMLQKHLVSRPQRPGFALNNYTLRNDPFDFRGFFSFDGFRNERVARFMFPRRTAKRGSRTYHRYTVTLRYLAKEQGSYTFGPAVLKGPVFTGVDAAGNPLTRAVFAVGPAVTVRVTPPPEEGRPPSFTGAVGSSLNVAASLDTQTCNAGDPLKLTLTLTGDFNTRNVYPPVLGDNDTLVRDFRVYDDTVQTERRDDGISYIYTLRPARSGTMEVPPIEVSFYDVDSRTYRTSASLPLPVRARQAAEVAAPIILNTSTGSNDAGREVEEEDTVPAPLDVSPTGAMPSAIWRPSAHIPLLAAGPCVCAVYLCVRFVISWFARCIGSGRRKRTVARAMRMLNDTDKAPADNPAEAARMICEAMGTYLKARFDAAAGELTPDGVRNVLRKRGISTATGSAFQAVFERNFNAAFDPAVASTAGPDHAAALDVINRIEREGGFKR